MDSPLGKHWLVELEQCDSYCLQSVDYVKNSLIQAAYKAQVKIVDSYFHQFQPAGVSGVVIIEQSHISIHTWYEFNYAAVDFFFCDDNVKLDNAIDYLTKQFKVNRVNRQLVERKPSS